MKNLIIALTLLILTSSTVYAKPHRVQFPYRIAKGVAKTMRGLNRVVTYGMGYPGDELDGMWLQSGNNGFFYQAPSLK